MNKDGLNITSNGSSIKIELGEIDKESCTYLSNKDNYFDISGFLEKINVTENCEADKNNFSIQLFFDSKTDDDLLNKSPDMTK